MGLAGVGLSGAIGSAPASARPVSVSRSSQSAAAFGVVVAGDSYSAGDGAGSYAGPAGCYRSPSNYAGQFVTAINKAPYRADATLTDVACSGAATADVVGTGPQQRASQVSQIPATTKLVFLTIGANDAHFANIEQSCLVAASRNGVSCNQWLTRAEALVNGGTTSTYATRLASVLSTIRAQAPAAKIVLAGYPYLISTPTYTIPEYAGKASPTVSVGQRLYAIQNALGNIANTVVNTAAKATPGSYFYVGTHGLFQGHSVNPNTATSTSWLVYPATTAPAATWFNPTATGWQHESALLLANAKTYGVPTNPGGAFTAVPAPLPANGNSYGRTWLNSVVCGGAGSCTAVGSYGSGLNQLGLIETQSHGTWTASEAPLPANAITAKQIAVLNSVVCAAAGSCTAVGRYDDSNKHQQGLIETLSGGVWTVAEAPAPADVSSAWGVELSSVACTAAGSCTAVGTYFADSGYTQVLIETLSGGVWTATEAPEPANSAADADPYVGPGSLACTAAGSCTAVGGYYDNSASRRGLIETRSHGVWTAAEAPTPANAGTTGPAYENLGSLTCGAAGSCTAVGQYDDTNEAQQGLIETRSHGVWTVAEAPTPVGANTTNPYESLASVVCVAAGVCTAVGQYDDSIYSPQGLIETQSGTAWTAAEIPAPADANADPFMKLNSVACVAAGSCTVVGQYYDDNQDYQALIETQG